MELIDNMKQLGWHLLARDFDVIDGKVDFIFKNRNLIFVVQQGRDKIVLKKRALAAAKIIKQYIDKKYTIYHGHILNSDRIHNIYKLNKD